LHGCHVELNHGIQVSVVKKDAQIRLLTAYMCLLRYAAKVAWAYIKYPEANAKIQAVCLKIPNPGLC